jgi:hypothetical protein
MRHYIRISSVIVALVLATGTTVSVAAPQERLPAVPVRIDVVVSRFQGEKKTSSLPFALFVNANTGNSVSLRLGVDVPVGTSTVTAGNESSNPNRTSTTNTSSTTSHVDYRNVGTSIDCGVSQNPDGRFSVNLRVQDSSLFTSDTDGKMTLKVADPMAFRTFTFSNTLTMRDGQTLLWATGADKITGEVLKLEATLTVVK